MPADRESREGGGEVRTVPLKLASERLGGKTYLYAAVLGFLFFFIGLFVFRKRPEDRSARIFFLLCVLFLLFFVCRLRPASYWWIDVFVQNTGTVSLFLLPAVFLHFFLIFPAAQAVPLRAARRVDGGGAAALEGVAPGVPLREPGAPLPALRDSALGLPLRRLPAAARRPRLDPVGRAALLVDPPRRLPDPGSRVARALGVHAAGRARAAPGLPRLRRDDPRDGPVPAPRNRPAFRVQHGRVRLLRHRPDDPDPADVRVRDRPLPDAEHPVRRAPDVPLRHHDGDPVRLLRDRDRGRQRRVRPLAARLLAALQLRVLPRRPAAVRVPAAPAPDAARQALLPRQVRLPGGASRDERGDHG